MTTAVNTTGAEAPSKVLHYSLWVAQLLLAAAFGMAGFMKATTPIAELALSLPMANELPEALIRFIGISELAGALGLVLPAATRIKPLLTPLAGLGLVVVMVLAAGFHVMRGEFGALPTNFALGALAAFVAWGRVRKAPIAER
jgi:hypothetical protein